MTSCRKKLSFSTGSVGKAGSLRNKQMGKIFWLGIIFKCDWIIKTLYSNRHTMNSLPATDQEL